MQQKRDAPEIGPAGALSHEMIHAGFVVKDRVAEDKFYKDMLGFRLYWHGGMKEGETDWVAMQVPDGTDWIEYMLNIPARRGQEGIRRNESHFAGSSEHMQRPMNELEAGWREIYRQPKIGRDGKWQLNLYDPDVTSDRADGVYAGGEAMLLGIYGEPS